MTNDYNDISTNALSELYNVIGSAYESMPHYSIIKKNDNKNCVAIYFSSNGIFYPDDVPTFTKRIYYEDRYELQHNMIERADKHLFLRDIYKSWYLLGINNQISSPERLLDFLRQETDGFKEIVMVGISSGGYASILFGSLLQADVILSFSPQWNLYEENIEKKICEKRKDVDFRKLQEYYDITSLGNYSHVYYFCPILSEQDNLQLHYAKEAKDIHVIKILNKEHGIVIPIESLRIVLNMSPTKLDKISSENKEWSQFHFLWRVSSSYDIYQIFKYIIKGLLYNLLAKKKILARLYRNAFVFL